KLWIAAKSIVKHDDVKGVEKLPLVFMDPLDLGVENRFGINGLPGRRFQPTGETCLRVTFGLPDGRAKVVVTGQSLKPLKLVEVRNPAIADCLADDFGQWWIREQQKAALSNAIRLVVESLRE